MAGEGARLRQDRDFVLVLGGQAVSALGDAVTITAVPLLVLALTGSGALMGLIGALQLVPDLFVGLLSGALSDRLDRRRLMFWSDLGRALLTALIPLAAVLDVAVLPVLLVTIVPINVLRVFSDSALRAALPQLVGREQFPRATAWFEATLTVPFVVGPAIAGALVVALGPAETLSIDAATFAVSAVAVALVRRPLRAPREAMSTTIGDDIREGIRFVRGHRVLRATIAFGALIGLVAAGLLPALGFYVTVDRGLDAAVFGYVGSAWSVGYFVASVVAGRAGPGRLGLRMVAGGFVLGAAVAAFAVSGNRAVLLAAAAGIGAALAVVVIAAMTLRTALTPDDLMGRVGGTAQTLSRGVQPIGLLLVGFLIEASTGRVALLAVAALAVLASARLAVSPAARSSRS